MDAISCLKTRRSVRRFEDRPVSRELLTEVVALAQFAPSWKNSQTVRYFIVDDPRLKDRLAEEAVACYPKNGNNLKSAAAAMIIATVPGVCGYEADGTPSSVLGSHWQSFDAGIATQTFCLAAHEKGLGSVIMGLYDPEKVTEIVQIPEDLQISCLLAVGYPAEGPHGRAVRMAVEDVLQFR